jgi:nucleoside-diphosphate-sugar epimerase
MGAEVRRGGLDDLDGLGKAAAEADAVIHLAFNHDAIAAGRFADAVATDLGVVNALGEALAGSRGSSGTETGKAFIGIGFLPTGDAARDAVIEANPRVAVSRAIAGFTGRGVRTMVMGVPPVTHSRRDRHGFIPMLINIARAKGVSAYVGEGANRWPAAHTLDVGRLFRLALEKAPAGTQLHAAAEEGIEVREIAEIIGRHLGVPSAGLSAEQAAEHFRTFPFIGLDITMSNDDTRRLLDWEPVHPGLIADLEDGHYFA